MTPEHDRVSVPYARGVPLPTSGPLWAGFGVTMMFAGLVTNWLVSVVGLVSAAAGFVAWARACFPEEAVEALPPGAEVPLPAPALERRREQARSALPGTMHPYRAGIRGGLAGGVAMAAAAVAWGLARHGSVWMPINLLAGVFLPSVSAESAEQLKAFQGGVFAVAVVIHAVACVFVGLLFTVSLPMMPRRPLLLGGVISPALWTGLLYATIGIVNPALERYVEWSWFFASQVAFGVVCGLVVSRSRRIDTMTGLPIADRLDVERHGGGA